MARITIVELQTVASDENFVDSAMDLSVDELKGLKGGDDDGYKGKGKGKDDDDDDKKRKYSCHSHYRNCGCGDDD